jgi:2-keto-4-pentenoate hydratase/2-oxohepta-3-ene-1,7-dioic acid hydratase in catechol pathway
MKIGRCVAADGKAISFASLGEKEGFRICDPDTCSMGDKLEIERFLPPVQPTKIIAVGLNYRDHITEMGHEFPTEPVLFMKPSTAVIGPFAEIRYPTQSSRVDYEAELAVVIGKTCRGVRAAQAKDFILGYTCFNDVTARDLQAKDGQWTRAKSFDTFAPIGPWVVTDIENPGALAITARLNGEIRQSSNTSNLIFGVFELVEYISGIMTLNPGDVIATGTPSGVGPMNPGDEIAIEIQDIGVLKNKVVK